MRAYLLTTRIIFALFTVAHVMITWEHLRAPDADLDSVLAPVVVTVISGGPALWAFRLTGA